jgi:nicotinamidase-related amidase
MPANKTALLIMDVQPSIVASVHDQNAYVDKVNQTAISARKKNIPILFVVVGFRPGFPEVGGHNKMFGSIKEQGSVGMIEPSPVIAPSEKDLVITKRRVSAFAGSDLEVILRGQGITHLVLCGIATSGVVLSTTREAADKDYGLIILSDLCRDRDEEVHRVLIEKVFPRQADVMTADKWLDSLPD